MPQFEITLTFEAENAEAAAAAVEHATFFNEPIAVTAPVQVAEEDEIDLDEDEEDDEGVRELTDREKAEALADFRSWSGGFDPWECDEDEIEDYGAADASTEAYLERCRVNHHA